MTRIIGILLLAMAFGIGTWVAGWMTVPAIGAIHALTRRNRRASLEAGVAAMTAWLVLLLILAPLPAFARLLSQLGEILPISGALLAALTVVWAGLLATSAARVTLGVAGIRAADKPSTDAPRGLPPDRR